MHEPFNHINDKNRVLELHSPMCNPSMGREPVNSDQLQDAMDQLNALRQLSKEQLKYLADRAHSNLAFDYQMLVYNTNFAWQLALEAQDFYNGLCENPGPYTLNQLYDDLITCLNQWSHYRKKLAAKMESP